METKAICWDAHGTIYQEPGHGRPSRAKSGLGQTLENLAQDGYVHFLTTGAKLETAKEMLKTIGLEKNFRTIFSSWDSNAKHYGKAAESLGWDNDEATRRMLIIGDRSDDRPSGIYPVFVLYPECATFPSGPLEGLIRRLQISVNGDFPEGYDQLFESGETKDRRVRNVELESRLRAELTKEERLFGSSSPTRTRVESAALPRIVTRTLKVTYTPILW